MKPILNYFQVSMKSTSVVVGTVFSKLEYCIVYLYYKFISQTISLQEFLINISALIFQVETSIFQIEKNRESKNLLFITRVISAILTDRSSSEDLWMSDSEIKWLSGKQGIFIFMKNQGRDPGTAWSSDGMFHIILLRKASNRSTP